MFVFSYDGDSDSALLRNSPESPTSCRWHLAQNFWPSANLCGETGIRTPETLLEFTRFPGVPLQPLEHLSFAPQSAFINIGYKITAFFSYTQVFAHFFRYFIAKSCRALALVSSMTYLTGQLYTCASRSAT